MPGDGLRRESGDFVPIYLSVGVCVPVRICAPVSRGVCCAVVVKSTYVVS